MKVTFDPAKDVVNQTKHGVSLAAAKDFEWESAIEWSDERRDYAEARSLALGYIGLRVMVMVFVDRPPDNPTERRVISLRKANSREVKRYAEA